MKKYFQKRLKNIWRIEKELLVLHPRFEGLKKEGKGKGEKE